VSEGESPDCAQQAKAAEDNEADTEATPTEDAKPAASAKSKTARSRRSSSFMRRVDRFLNRR
jgi:hypothetical protein